MALTISAIFLKNCQESMINNLHEHKKDALAFADKKHLCPPVRRIQISKTHPLF